MKAMLIREYGGPEVLRWEEVPTPTPGPAGEARLGGLQEGSWALVMGAAGDPGVTVPLPVNQLPSLQHCANAVKWCKVERSHENWTTGSARMARPPG